LLPALGRFVQSRDPGDLKARLIHAALGGAQRAQIDALNVEFLPKLLSSGVYADALTAIGFHRQAGHHLILMSASVDLYVPEIGSALQFNETLCTQVRWNGSRLDGALVGVNCRGEEKRRLLLQTRMANPGCTIFAYGNSAPDLPHLREADHGVLVNAPATLRRRAQSDGIECRLWR
jgi:HAD superfamily phosphoserine phosphatase-like hydrolase